MTITCNGETYAAEAVTVAELLERRLGDARPHGVAVAVNEEVVPRGEWASWRLTDGDVVEVVTAVQGG
ncbi:sulfur carrier protein ThiS [Nocardioides daeguensis]|uniref:Sulfur carrier protein ThiS n=1 Tax=Nocardioides daeguensis TaxID=908359 RepID=A0ABP6W0R3_9ACTN|nr:sulfur carrier protein ThiS [Nocardioides daeguensis]MBV6727597.1 sulfur carrier protein ThiS [Nocardioides daeguensis]MCR1771454.1 sulfur carrier protein ThiS [Nocardioides daeguensis]